MVLIHEATPDDWEVVRGIRLAALREVPDAFGSTYEREVAFAEADWRGRLGSGGVTYLAHLPDIYDAGIAGGFEESPGTVELVSMWVNPGARGHGIGQALIDAVAGWARSRGCAGVHLWVTDTNASARGLYERTGFIETGERQPLPSNPALGEIGMRRTL